MGAVAKGTVLGFEAFANQIGFIFIQGNQDRFLPSAQGMVSGVAIRPKPRLHACANKDVFFAGYFLRPVFSHKSIQ